MAALQLAETVTLAKEPSEISTFARIRGDFCASSVSYIQVLGFTHNPIVKCRAAVVWSKYSSRSQFVHTVSFDPTQELANRGCLVDSCDDSKISPPD